MSKATKRNKIRLAYEMNEAMIYGSADGAGNSIPCPADQPIIRGMIKRDLARFTKTGSY